jgi:hypothetical protein
MVLMGVDGLTAAPILYFSFNFSISLWAGVWEGVHERLSCGSSLSKLFLSTFPKVVYL